MKIETLAIHAGRGVDKTTGAVAEPIYLSTTFERDADGGFSRGFEYIRDSNPNRNALEQCMAQLEGGHAAVALPSGMAAIAAALEVLAIDHPGTILLPDDMYFGIRSLLGETHFGRHLTVVSVDMTDLAAVARACDQYRPSIIWAETPSNPLVGIVDLAGIARIAKGIGAALGVDNTWATPLLQRPLDFGADIVIHSLTKYIGGHSDVMGGIAVVQEPGRHLDELRAIVKHRGSVMAPFDCWLALRGISSLPARMKMHCANAAAIASHLEGHPAVARVCFPGLKSHPGHDVAKRQMLDFGGMLSFKVIGGRAAAMAVAAALKIFTRATSLGGSHSLIEHRASVEGPATIAPEGLLRVSVGLENVDDLIDDLDQALMKANGS
jgi:cystathionine gamma-synthase